MKTRLLLLTSLVLLNFFTFSQNKVNLVVFSEDGDAFYAYVNGIKQNSNPETNVKVTGVTPNISLRIEFENKALPQLKQNMALEPGFEHTAKIKRDTKKQLKLRYFGQTPLDDATNNNVPTVAYHTSDATTTNNYNTSTTNDNGHTTVTTTSTTTQVKNNTKPNDVSVNINVGGAGLNMNVSGMDLDQTNTTNYSTTSTTISSSSSNSNVTPKNKTQTSTTTQTESQPRTLGCSNAMTSSNFEKMKKSVDEKPFSETKMSTAKVATKNNCLSVNQIKEISKLFSMDDDKLAYAKFAFDYCVDKANYYQVGEVFSFSTTTDDLNEFLETR